MSDNAITFIQLSDTHFYPAGATAPHGLDPAANLRRVADWVETEGLDPSFFLISGDLSNDGDPESYRHFATALRALEGRFGVPILLGLGNHDRRGPFRRLVLGEPVGDDDQTPYYYSRQVGGLRVLMLDSLLPGEIDGELGAAQLAWLAEELRRPAPSGALVVLHHPVTPRGIPRAQEYPLRDAAALLALTAGRPPLGILGGHTHVSTAALAGGTLAITAPSVAFQFDPTGRAGLRLIAGAGCNLCTVRDGQLLVNPIVLPGGGQVLAHLG